MTPNTMRAYHSRIKQFLLFVEYTELKDAPLDDDASRTDAMDLYLNFLRENKKGSVTINANIDALNNFTVFLGGQPAGTLKRERCYGKPPKMLTLPERERFLRCVEQQEMARDRALALVLFYTGLRIGDCARLNIDNVGAGASCICMGVVLPLNEQTSEALSEYLEQRKRLPTSAGAGTALWLTNQGQRLTIPGISFVIKRIGWQAKIALSVEMLRRTCLASAAENLNKDEQATRFGGYVSQAALNKYSFNF